MEFSDILLLAVDRAMNEEVGKFWSGARGWPSSAIDRIYKFHLRSGLNLCNARENHLTPDRKRFQSCLAREISLKENDDFFMSRIFKKDQTWGRIFPRESLLT